MARQVIRNAKGEPFSRWKPAEKFLHTWNREGLGGGKFELEYVFDSSRRWRFDFAWPRQMLAVEIDGFGFGHQAQQRISENNEKQNAAVEQGWSVLRFDSRLLGSRQSVSDAVEQVSRVLCGAEKVNHE